MRILKLTFFYLMIMLLAMALSLAGVRMSVALGIFAFIVVAVIYRHVHILYRTNNMQQVDKFVKNQKKQPFFAYVYAIAHSTKAEQLQVLDEVIVKIKQPAIKNNYLFNKAILEQDITAAKEAAEKIQKEPLTSYALCYIAALEGRTTDMRSEKLTQHWMQPAIEAVFAHQMKDETAFDRFTKESIDAARGIQKYSLIHSFKQMKNEVKKS
ncbi:hypothetical protein AEA09_08800 [Lysinibacillus contaminans]|uniref:DUF4760 domain-containing protein n=1 Tax=Lysinibacillus contaminans TaxID=1293441 RepID=A0ABR5K144_9BACI|nr:hypothetical protein [Lysinibacillus contaminans]KOS68632.1 hypothetical protein AEA09_08800 [Lysinibacillus contaminans]